MKPNGAKTVIWSIAGADPGSGAGIQADLLAGTDLGVHVCTVISALTVQNSVAVSQVEAVPEPLLQAQLSSLITDMPPRVIKLGLLVSANQIRSLVQWFSSAEFASVQPRPAIVYDPVAVASGGQRMAAADVLEALPALLPWCDLVTPNAVELATITGIDPQDPARVLQGVQCLRRLGAKAVLVKGGHLSWSAVDCVDYLQAEGLDAWFCLPRLLAAQGQAKTAHGSGCSLASAIAALLAQDYVLEDAVTLARAWLQRGLAESIRIGQGPGPVACTGWPQTLAHFPQVLLPGSPQAQALGLVWAVNSKQAVPFPAEPFARTALQLGVYPVVDSVDWVARLLEWGVRTLQLRIKDPACPTLAKQIQQAVTLAQSYQARLFINDYWQLAIQHGAYGVHLGQEDLACADLQAIQQAGLRLGLSTHGFYEVARVLPLQPSYIALGHIFPTQTKDMPSAPQGLTRLAAGVRLLQGVSCVAIGGISEARFSAVQATGVGSIALVSAITQAADPAAVTARLLQQWRSKEGLNA